MELSTNKLFLYRFIGYFYRINIFVFWLLGYSYLKAILNSGTLFENGAYQYTNFWGKSFVLFFAFVNYLSYMALLAFLPALILFILTTFLPYKRLIIFLSVISAYLSVLFLIGDSQVYAMFKFHINTPLLAMFFSKVMLAIFHFSSAELLAISVTVLVALLFEVFLAYFVWKKVRFLKKKQGKTLVMLCLGGLLFSYFTLMISMANKNNLLSQQTPNLPIFTQLISYLIPHKQANILFTRTSESHFSQPSFPKGNLNYPLHPLECTPPQKPYNIILIMIDTLRADHLNKSLMPNLTHFADKSWQFLQHYSGGNSTQAGLFSLFYSLPSNYWTAALEQQRPPVFNDLLKKYNYQTQIIWSSELEYPSFDKTIYLGLDNLPLNKKYNFDRVAEDRQTTQQAIDFLQNNDRKKPFFLNLFYDAVHAYCEEQSNALDSQSIQSCFRFFRGVDSDPKPIYKRYANAVKFIDGELAKVLEVIEKENYLTNSVVIITSDHGEEFNDSQQNFWGHASNFTSYQTQVPFIIYWPNQGLKKIDHLTTHYDLMPTLLDYWGCKNPKVDYSIGQNLLDREGRLPFVLAGGYANMGIIEPDRSTTLQTSGGLTISDFQGHPLPGAKVREDIMEQSLNLMRRYFNSAW